VRAWLRARPGRSAGRSPPRVAVTWWILPGSPPAR